MAVIETTGLTKRFPAVLAVDRVSLTVEQGQVFGFLGPNGSGKTTTIGMLMGIIKPTAGSFRLFGAGAPRDLLAARARVGATLETPNFYPYLSGRDNLRIAAAIKGIGKARIEECLDIVGLRGRGKHRFRTYSLGMKQRLALAATMLNDPELIVLDEPANGLDPKGMKEVRDIIRLLAERGKTIFLSSHLLWEVERTCTHVSIVRKGRVVGTGTVAEIVGGEITAVVRAEDDEALLRGPGGFSGGNVRARVRRRAGGRAGVGRPRGPQPVSRGPGDLRLAPRAAAPEPRGRLHGPDRRRRRCGPGVADGVRLMRLLGVLWRIETLKAVKRPAFWVTMGVFTVFNAIAILSSGGPSSEASFPDAWRGIIEPATNLGPVFLAALMILLFAPEFRWRTARQNVIDGLGKEQFYWGKVLLLVPMMAVFIAIPMVIGVLEVARKPRVRGGGALHRAHGLQLHAGVRRRTAALGHGRVDDLGAGSGRRRRAGSALPLFHLRADRHATAFDSVARPRSLLRLPARPVVPDDHRTRPCTTPRCWHAPTPHGPNAARICWFTPILWVPLVAAMAYVVLFLGLAYVNMRRRDL